MRKIRGIKNVGSIFKIEDLGENTEYEYTRTKSTRKLILLVAITAIMLISSTYAWFSAQKNVTLGNLEGKVNVAEGLMVSLDAKNWSQEVNFDSPILDAGQTLDVPYSASADGTSYSAGKNNRPEELIPVSATGVEDLNTNEEMTFYTGTNINISELYGIQKVKAHKSESANGSVDPQYAGFYAIDLFLQNSSKIGEGETQGTATETLQLNTNSLLQVLTAGGASSTGLQNTARVALAMYDTTGLTNSASTIETDTSSIYITANQSQV